MTGSKYSGGPGFPGEHPQDATSTAYLFHSSGNRISTETVIAESLHHQYPDLLITVTDEVYTNLLGFAAAGFATATPLADTQFAALRWLRYIPSNRRLDNNPGRLANVPKFAKYGYKWEGHEFILYVVDGRDGSMSYPEVVNSYLLSSDSAAVDKLVLAASKYASEIHNEVWVFDRGYWQKSRELWESIQGADWDNVILDKDLKRAIQEDVMGFFDARDTYAKLKVPWKKGIIFYGPPGNGKTISIKAVMHSLYQKKPPVPTLYVRSLASFGGPEAAVGAIFAKARKEAPCYLVFEDLDSIIDDRTRSYFLNEVDGLRANDGIFMVGSTNHLDRLDPGLAKRPSRFDRKYLFPNPNFDQRIAYSAFWQRKLADNKDIAFPDKLNRAIASITDGFSFAYMQEAFVSALMTIATHQSESAYATSQGLQEAEAKWRRTAGLDAYLTSKLARELILEEGEGDDGDLDEYRLWREIKKQIKSLREEMGRDEQ